MIDLNIIDFSLKDNTIYIMKKNNSKQVYDIPQYDPYTGEINPYYEELTGKKNPYRLNKEKNLLKKLWKKIF